VGSRPTRPIATARDDADAELDALDRTGRYAAQPQPAPRGARNGTDAVVRGETGDQTGQESRSAGHRAGTSLTVMDIAIHMTFLSHVDPGASLAFYRDRPEVVPVVLLLLQAGPG